MAKIPRLTRYEDFTQKTDLLGDLLEEDIITKLEKTSATVATLPSGSSLTLGETRQSLSSNLTVDTSIVGLGGMEVAIVALTFYYVYVVLDNSAVSLIASTDEIKPTSYSIYKKVGAFYTDVNSDIHTVYFFGEINNLTLSARINSNGTMFQQFPNNFTSSSRVGVGQYSGTFTKAFTSTPQMTGTASGGGDQMNLRGGASTTGWSYTIANPNISLQDQIGVIHFHKVGLDAVQPNWNTY